MPPPWSCSSSLWNSCLSKGRMFSSSHPFKESQCNIFQAELTTNQVLQTERESVKPEASTKARSLVPPQLRPGRIQIWLVKCDVEPERKKPYDGTRIFPKTWLCWTCSWWKCNLRNTGDLPRLGRNSHGGSEPGPGFPKQWEPERRNTCPENFHLSRKL